MADQYSGLGAQLIVFDSTSSNGDVTVPNGHFHFTCQFTKGKNGRIFEGMTLTLLFAHYKLNVKYNL